MNDLTIEQPVEPIEEVEDLVTLRGPEVRQEVIPEYPILGYSGNEKETTTIDFVTVPQNGVFGNLFSQPASHTPYIVDGLPTRMTYCCNVPFQIGARGTPECSNPECPERQKVQA